MFRIHTTFICLLIGLLGAFSTGFAQDDESNESIESIKQRYLPGSKSVMILTGNYRIAEGTTVSGDIIVFRGDLVVGGILNGRAVVTDGDIAVKQNGQIDKAIAIKGKVTYEGNHSDFSDTDGQEELLDDADEMETIPAPPSPPKVPKFGSGDQSWRDFDIQMQAYKDRMEAFHHEMEQFNSRMDELTRKLNQKYSYSYKSRSDYDEDDQDEDYEDDETAEDDRTHSASFVRVDDPGSDWRNDRKRRSSGIKYFLEREPRYKYTNFFLFDYNRVDGAYIGAKIDRHHKMYEHKPFEIYGEIGYAFSAKAFRYQIGLDKVWNRPYDFTIGGEAHVLTGSQDEWLVGNVENAFNALLLNRDYRDYYRKEGFSFEASQQLNDVLKVSALYKIDNYSSLDNEIRWSLFRPKQEFRVNPAIDEGRMSSYAGMVDLNTVSTVRTGKKYVKRVGWILHAEAERSLKSLNSDFEFTRYMVSAVRYQPLSRWENLDMRLMAGSATGIVPRQMLFNMGGISTLRGHDFKAFSGNQMILTNVEYRLSSGILKNDRIFPLHPFSVILFMDNGYAWRNQIYAAKDAFKGVHLSDLETDLGVGFGDEKNIFRFDIAKSVSEKNSDYKFNVRINYAF